MPALIGPEALTKFKTAKDIYVYSRATLERHARVFREGLSILPKVHVAFAVKSNPNLAVLKILQREGYGADVVSGGELKRALAAGMPAEDIVFSGVGKTRAELQLGLDEGIGQFNLELEEEGEVLAGLAHAQGKVALVWVDETRPVMQGSRLTAWECVRDGIPHRLIADVAAASVMARGEVDLIVTGADRIAANGDTANKIGTYGLAVLARHHRVPFYVAAPFSTIDPALASGAEIPIEERDAGEVRGVVGRPTAPAASPVYNPAFDVTPAELITAIITERGVFRPPYRFT